MTLVDYKYEREKNKNSDTQKQFNNINENSEKNNTKVINNLIVQNNNNYICSFSDLLSSDSNKTTSSNTDRKTELFIEKNLNFSYSREYVNLKELTNGEISKNVKFMQKSTNYIKNLYIKLKNKRKKNEEKNKSSIYNNSNKEILEFNSDKSISQSMVSKNNEKKIKEIDKDIDQTFSPKKIKKLQINLNDNKDNNSRVTLLNMNNVSNYTFKMNFNTTLNQNNISKELINNETKEKFNNQNHNFKKNLINSFYDKNTEIISNNNVGYDRESKSKNKIINLNNLSYKAHENYSFNDFNSCIEQELKNEELSQQRREFINIKRNY